MKTRIIILSIVAVVAMFAIPSITAGAATSSPSAVVPTTTNIDFSPTFVGGDCDNFAPSTTNYDIGLMAAWDGITDYTRTDTNTTFTVKFKLNKNLCNPFNARATVYNLPANATSDFLPSAWPQTRYSSLEFEIHESGTYIVTFNKSCAAQQFDVHTGVAPLTLDSINSTTYHGPLLFGSPVLDALSGSANSSSTIFYGSQSCQGPAAPALTGTSVPPTNTNIDYVPTQTTGCVNFTPSYDYDRDNLAQLLAITSHTTIDTASSFTVKFTLPQNLCAPFTARASIYNLPAGATPAWLPTAWPQSFYSSVGFEVFQSGTYTVTFSKTCVAQQFDVHTGVAPHSEISNGGTYHGPLLYPVRNPFWFLGEETNPSALIWYGSACQPTTTTTTEPTTTTTTLATTTLPTSSTTLPATVLGTTVTRPGDPGVKVAGINVSKTLPVTGTQSTFMVTIAFALITSGAIFFAVSRRRRLVVK